MKKRIILLDWQADNARGVAGKFQSSGWKVEMKGENRVSSYAQVLKKTPAVLLYYSNPLAPQPREHRKTVKNKISIPAFGLL